MSQIKTKFIKDANVTNAKLANMANNTVKGNTSGGSSAPSDLALSDVAETGSSILTITNGSKAIVGASNLTIKANLTSANVYVGNASNVAVGVALTGDVTISNAGVTAIGSNKVANSQLAQMAAHTFKGNNTGSTANVLDLTATQLTAELNNFVGDSGSGGTKGLTPAPASGDAAAGKFLKADGTWAAPTASSVVGLIGYANFAPGTSCIWTAATSTYTSYSANSNCNLPTIYSPSSVMTNTGSKTPGVIVTSLAAGFYQVTAQFIGGGSGGVIQYYQLWDGTTASGQFTGNGSAVGNAGVAIIAYFQYGSTQTNITFQIQGKASSGAAAIYNDNSNGSYFAITVTRLY